MYEKQANKIFKNLVIGIALLLIIIIGITIFKIAKEEKRKQNLQWQEGEMGTITEDYEQGEMEEKKESIIDAYGNEYEYTPIPSIGAALYLPKDWTAYGDGKYIYIAAPEDHHLVHTEIAICTNNLEDLDYSSTGSIIGPADYIQNSLKYHTHDLELDLSLTNENNYKAEYDYSSTVFISKDNGEYKEYTEKPDGVSVMEEGPKLVGYHSSPNLVFVDPDNVFTHTSPYSVFYFCRLGNTEQSLFFSVIGPRNYELELEEIATTIAYNISEYVSDAHDYDKVFTNVNMEKEKLNRLEFFYKDDEDATNMKGNDFFKNIISTDPLSIGYNCIFSIVYKPGRMMEDCLTTDDMMEIFGMDESVSKGYQKALGRNILKPDFKKRAGDTIVIANKEAQTIEWEADAKYIHNGRNYFYPNMPKRYYSYLIPSEEGTYICTISYQTHQKYSAKKYMDNAMLMVGFH